MFNPFQYLGNLLDARIAGQLIQSQSKPTSKRRAFGINGMRASNMTEVGFGLKEHFDGKNRTASRLAKHHAYVDHIANRRALRRADASGDLTGYIKQAA